MNRSEVLERFNPQKDNLLGILHGLQNGNPNNYLTESDLKAVAEYLNITFSHVFGVVTYYTMFSLKQRGKYIIRICNSPVCNMKRSLSLADEIRDLLGIGVGETTGDMLFTLEYTECLGRCDVAPSIMVAEDVYGNVTRKSLASIIKKYK